MRSNQNIVISGGIVNQTKVKRVKWLETAPGPSRARVGLGGQNGRMAGGNSSNKLVSKVIDPKINYSLNYDL